MYSVSIQVYCNASADSHQALGGGGAESSKAKSSRQAGEAALSLRPYTRQFRDSGQLLRAQHGLIAPAVPTAHGPVRRLPPLTRLPSTLRVDTDRPRALHD